MRLILTAMLVSSLIGCAKFLPVDFPKFPSEIKGEHLVIFEGKEPHCFFVEIETLFPRKFKKPVEVNLLDCDGVSGLLPKEAVKVDNWMDDVYKWSTDNKCFRN